MLTRNAGEKLICCELRDFSLAFPDNDQRKVLDQINLRIDNGESILLLGPSGSGKSTLGYVLGGLVPHSIEAETTGEIILNQRAGMVFQDPESQFCMLTVEDEMAFGLENLRVPREQMASRIDQTLRQSGLQARNSQMITTMSGGMKQRLAMACSSVMNPQLYILDEPTANLDPVGTADLFHQLHKLWKLEKKTMVLIEHKVEGVSDWVDRVLLLGPDGRILDDGSPNEIFRRRQSEIQKFGIWQPQLWGWSHLLKLDLSQLSSQKLTSPEAWVENLTEEQTSQLRSHLEKKPVLSKKQEMKPTVFEVRDAEFAYGKEATVWGPISFDIPAGEWVAIVGPNGSGKSTMLASLMGLRDLKQGSIHLQGKSLAAYTVNELSQEIGFVFQNPEHQFVTDTVREEVAFGTKVAFTEAETEAEQQVDSVLEGLGLKHVENANPFSLSQGEKRRLSVATTFLQPHNVLLLDEPTFGQDAYTAKELEEKLAELHASGSTLIMVTHDMELVARRATRVLVLTDGELIYNGSAAELFEQADILQRAKLSKPLSVELAELIHIKQQNRGSETFATVNRN